MSTTAPTSQVRDCKYTDDPDEIRRVVGMLYWEGLYMNEGTAQYWFKRIMWERESFIHALTYVYRDGQIIGWGILADYAIATGRAPREGSPRSVVSVYVKPEYRRMGYGSTLLSKVQQNTHGHVIYADKDRHDTRDFFARQDQPYWSW